MYFYQFQHNLGLRHRKGPKVRVHGQQGHRVHHRQGGCFQRLRRHHTILVSNCLR